MVAGEEAEWGDGHCAEQLFDFVVGVRFRCLGWEPSFCFWFFVSCEAMRKFDSVMCG